MYIYKYKYTYSDLNVYHAYNNINIYEDKISVSCMQIVSNKLATLFLTVILNKNKYLN